MSFGPTTVATELYDVTSNVHETYEFMLERVLPFIASFDARQPS